MNNTCSPAFFFLAAFACLFPASANAQMFVNYDQSLALLPVESQFQNTAVGAPLTFSQANMYSPQPAYAQANMYSQPLTFSQANTYSPGDTYAQANMYSSPNTYPQLNITSVEGQSNGIYSSIPASPVEIAIPQVPAYSAPIESHSPALPLTVACST